MKGWRLVVVGCVFGAAAAVLVAALVTTRGEETEPAQIAEGEVFSAAAGDPLDIVFGPDGCMLVIGSQYPSSTACIDLATVDGSGSWQLVIPLVEQKPPLVVGILPADVRSATAEVGSTRIKANTRGRWFLASLQPGALGQRNDVPVEVVYGS